MSLRFDMGEVITAMVTPMKKDGSVDYDAAEKLAKYLVDNGSDSIIVAGTTGESPALTHVEEVELLSSVKRAVSNKAKVIMGAGSNCTSEAVKYAQKAEKEGSDAILSVVPYYNKPSQEGMVAHFSEIASAVKIPVIIYNIPSRTGVNMLPETVKILAQKFSNIVAIKQSYADLDLVSEMRMMCPSDFAIYCGDDSLTLAMLALGANGVISVASHLYGEDIKGMIDDFNAGNIDSARETHLSLYPVFKKLFMAPNPVPVKAALAKNDVIKQHVRKPLVELTELQKKELYKVLDDFEQK